MPLKQLALAPSVRASVCASVSVAAACRCARQLFFDPHAPIRLGRAWRPPRSSATDNGQLQLSSHASASFAAREVQRSRAPSAAETSDERGRGREERAGANEEDEAGEDNEADAQSNEAAVGADGVVVVVAAVRDSAGGGRPPLHSAGHAGC